MSNEQSQPGPGEQPGPDPAGEQPPTGSSDAGGLPRYESAPPPGDAYGTNPYGGPSGAVDPLAGMPPLASLPRRLIARILDLLIIGIPVGLIMGLATDTYSTGYDTGTDGRTYLQQVIYLLVYFVYEGLMLTTRGQTLGKMAMKIRVGMLRDGAVPSGNPGWFRAAVYSLAQLVPCIGFVFWLINVLFCTWDRPYRQCLHDKAAKTVVVSTR
jgi:uncharacterized RDD family membrane protein YckC